MLTKPPLNSIPLPVLQKFMTKAASNEPVVPEWAVEHVEQSKLIAERKAAEFAESGRPERPPRPPRKPRDFPSDRIEMLTKTMTAFADKPELGIKLIELSGRDKAALDAILFQVGHPKFGPAYKQLMELTVPYAKSMEPVEYMLKFLKEGNEDGAFSAVRMMKPEFDKSAQEIEDAMIAAAEQKGEEIDYAEISEAAEQAVLEGGQRADANWMTAQKLLHDIVAGNIQGPPREGGGGRFGGPGGRGGDRGGDRGGGRGFGGGGNRDRGPRQ
jgi:hypothetical protein